MAPIDCHHELWVKQIFNRANNNNNTFKREKQKQMMGLSNWWNLGAFVCVRFAYSDKVRFEFYGNVLRYYEVLSKCKYLALLIKVLCTNQITIKLLFTLCVDASFASIEIIYMLIPSLSLWFCLPWSPLVCSLFALMHLSITSDPNTFRNAFVYISITCMVHVEQPKENVSHLCTLRTEVGRIQ